MFYFSSAFFLEDIVDRLGFVPPPSIKKRGKDKDKDRDEEYPGEIDEENMNLKISDEYSPSTKQALAKLSEKEICFELIEVNRLIKSICIAVEVQ